MLYLRRVATIFEITVVAALFAAGCSSSDDDAGSGQAGAQVLDSDFQLGAPFTEGRPKVRIPMQYTCHGENLSPPLTWSGGPDGTTSYALIAQDLDHLTGTWVHWVVYNIPADVAELAQGLSTSTEALPDGTTQGTNDHKSLGYEGPCPDQIVIPGLGYRYNDSTNQEPAHKHSFTLYALDASLALEPGASKSKLLKAMEGHILAQTETVGKFQLPVVTSMGQEFNKESTGGQFAEGGGVRLTTTPSQP